MSTESDNPIGSNDNNIRSNWLTRKIYETEAEKKKDFWRGVGLFFGLNIIMGVCSIAATFGLNGLFGITSGSFANSNLYTTLFCILNLLPWMINIGLVIYFALTRSQIAYGMVAGFGIGLLITICLGVIFMAYCFYTYGNM